jgi:hypothetical protein
VGLVWESVTSHFTGYDLWSDKHPRLGAGYAES